MSESSLQAQGGLENQPVMPVRRLNNFVFCQRLFYFQWVENIFQESADTVAGSNVHRNVDAPSRLDECTSANDASLSIDAMARPYLVRSRVTIV